MKGEDDVISKSTQFHIRLSKQEYQKIQSNSKRANLTMSQFARRALTGEIIQEAKPIDYYRLYNEINKIGVNINQIAKVANTTKTIDAISIKEICSLLTKIYCLLDEGVK